MISVQVQEFSSPSGFGKKRLRREQKREWMGESKI
jgi:hypothetical protein